MSLVSASLLSLFAPQGRMKSFYKMLIALFVFASFIYPLRDFKMPDFSAKAADSLSLMEDSDDNAYAVMVNRQVEAALASHNIVGARVRSIADYDAETGEITLSAVEVALPDEYNIAEVQALLLNTLGINARVIHIGD